ncbi:MAG: histone deacetylase [Actinomycetota bacterium]|nr:histone deacetylase [Actinomycetota bacterium]
MPPVLLHHPASLEHDPGPHPDQPARMVAIERELAPRDWLGWERRESPEASRSVLEAVHPPAYLDHLEGLSARGGGMLDMDTIMSEGSWRAALHVAGGAVAGVDLVLGGEERVAASAHRPPGHHATRTRAMGFCLVNGVAVAAQHALDAHGLQRVLVLDWDVHHGNGTNDIFLDSERVLFASIHQSPLYPGTGPASEVGEGGGTGYTVNLPVPPGSGDETWVSLLAHVVRPLAQAFAPQLVLVSAGYDAHADDPLGSCRVSDGGFAGMAAHVRSLAEAAGAPVVVVLEGGYDLAALARSFAATLEVLGAPSTPAPPEPPVHRLAAEARGRLATYWTLPE